MLRSQNYIFFGSNSTCVPYFGSCSSHTLPLKTYITVVPWEICLTADINEFFFILASSKLTAVNIYKKDNFGPDSWSQLFGSATLISVYSDCVRYVAWRALSQARLPVVPVFVRSFQQQQQLFCSKIPIGGLAKVSCHSYYFYIAW